MDGAMPESLSEWVIVGMSVSVTDAENKNKEWWKFTGKSFEKHNRKFMEWDLLESIECGSQSKFAGFVRGDNS